MAAIFSNIGRLAAVALSLLATALASAAVIVTDDTDRKVRLADTPDRIVSLAPGATEMLFAAGAGERVIATVEYSDEPLAARDVPRIGDASAIDMERLVALRPDVVVVWPGGGNPAQTERVAQLGIPVYRQQVDALHELPASLRRLGKLTGTSEIAERAAADIDTRLAGLAHRYGGTHHAKRVFLQVWNRPVYTVGGTHMMTDALQLCGATNVFGELRERGPAVDVEAVIARDPDVIVAVAPPGVAEQWLERWKAFSSLRAVRDNQLIAFEDQRLSRLGPSAIDATEALCRTLVAAR